MNNAAQYYRNLYQQPPVKPHEYHKIVEDQIDEWMTIRDYEHENDMIKPRLTDVQKAINKKKYKSATNLNYELIKRGGAYMAKSVYKWVNYI